MNFDRPEKNTIEDQLRRHRAAKAAVTRRRNKKMRSAPKKKYTVAVKDRPCKSEDGKCDDPCLKDGYARDPYLRDVGDRTVWVCYNAYHRGYRRLCRSQDKPYDARHMNGRLAARRKHERRHGAPWRRYV